MNVEPAAQASVGELHVVFARVQGMLLSESDAAAAVEQLAHVARDLVATAVGAGASVIDESGHPTSTGMTDKVVAAADALQYEMGQGPCVSAWASVAVQRIDDTAREDRWPAWCTAVQELGVRSVLSVPMVFKGRAVGAMKVYSTAGDPFTVEDEQRLMLLAGAAATLLATAQGADAPQRLSAGLQVALADRQAVETATGLVMERHDLTREAARSRLLAASRARRQPLPELARQLLARTTELPE